MRSGLRLTLPFLALLLGVTGCADDEGAVHDGGTPVPTAAPTATATPTGAIPFTIRSSAQPGAQPRAEREERPPASVTGRAAILHSGGTTLSVDTRSGTIRDVATIIPRVPADPHANQRFEPSPDGTRFAFSCDDAGAWSDTTHPNLCAGTAASSSIVVHGDDLPFPGNIKQTSGAGIEVEWSPDGNKIAFKAFPRDELSGNLSLGAWYVVDLTNGVATPIADARRGDLFAALRWSPDSTRVGMLGQSNGNALTVVDVASGDRLQVGANISSVLAIRGYAWSPSGDAIAFTATDDPERIGSIYLAQLKKAAVTHILDNAAISPSAWSPDGSWLAVVRPRPGFATDDRAIDAWVVRNDGTDARRLGAALPYKEAPFTWARDNRRLAFHGRDASGTRGLYVTEINGGAAVLVAEEPDFGPTSPARQFAVWSPDGNTLLFTQGGYCYKGFCVSGRLFLFDVTTGAPPVAIGDLLIDRILRSPD